MPRASRDAEALQSPRVIPRAPKPYETVQAGRASIRFFLGDSVDVLAELPQQSLDLVVTSPPYNLGIQYRTYDDGKPQRDYLDWTGRWVAAVARVLGPQGSLFLNVGAKPTEPWTALDVAQAARPHLRLQNILHWIKSIAIEAEAAGARTGLTEDLAVGHYKPINSTRFLNDCHEFVFHFTPEGSTRLDRLALGVKYQDPSNVARWRAGSGGRRCRGNAWFIPYETIQNRDKDRPHPATFPSRLPEYCVRLHGLARARTVADPFLGLGSTTVACARLGVDAIGIEIDEHYLKEAIARTRAAVTARETRRTAAARRVTTA
jgi:site-specific DNA-methyltransferase (adenine-specific)